MMQDDQTCSKTISFQSNDLEKGKALLHFELCSFCAKNVLKWSSVCSLGISASLPWTVSLTSLLHHYNIEYLTWVVERGSTGAPYPPPL